MTARIILNWITALLLALVGVVLYLAGETKSAGLCGFFAFVCLSVALWGDQ